jgi:hypothetical protein
MTYLVPENTSERRPVLGGYLPGVCQLPDDYLTEQIVIWMAWREKQAVQYL